MGHGSIFKGLELLNSNDPFVNKSMEFLLENKITSDKAESALALAINAIKGV
jgi:hypothetical protein